MLTKSLILPSEAQHLIRFSFHSILFTCTAHDRHPYRNYFLFSAGSQTLILRAFGRFSQPMHNFVLNSLYEDHCYIEKFLKLSGFVDCELVCCIYTSYIIDTSFMCKRRMYTIILHPTETDTDKPKSNRPLSKL